MCAVLVTVYALLSTLMCAMFVAAVQGVDREKDEGVCIRCTFPCTMGGLWVAGSLWRASGEHD